VDRSFSFAGLDKLLGENGNLSRQKQRIEPHREEPAYRSASLTDFGTGFFDFPVATSCNEEYDPNRLKKKKKRRLKL
jgi:hypothetical protein